jgi:outer membrane protein TolC
MHNYNKIIKIISCLILFIIFSPSANAAKSCLSLNSYLTQVRKFNVGLAGWSMIGQAAKNRIGEGRLLMKPTLFGEGQYLKNSYNPNWSPATGNSSSLQSYSMGVSETTPFGLRGKIYYNYQHQRVNGISPLEDHKSVNGISPLEDHKSVNGVSPLEDHTSVTASSPIAELDLPLSRNWAGRETRATANLSDAQTKLTDHNQRYKISTLLAEAESTYWRLAIARNIVAKRRQSLDRALQIKQWVVHRVQLRLGENADLLQAEAAIEADNLNYQAAVSDERLAESNFNTLRGSHQMCVSENLVSFSENITAKLYIPNCPGIREDVRIAEQERNIEIANAAIGIEKNKPDIELYGSVALNGKNPRSNQAVAESFTTNYPTTAVGLRLSVPLDLGQLKRDRRSYRQEIEGAKCQFDQKLYENNREWQQIALKIQNAQRRLVIAVSLERIQQNKLELERKRLTLGKTTTNQVLLFEQDFANSQITRLTIQDELLELMTQLKLFEV